MDARARRAWLLSVLVPSRLLGPAIDGWVRGGAFETPESLLYSVALAIARTHMDDDYALKYLRLCENAPQFGDRALWGIYLDARAGHAAQVNAAVPLRWCKHQIVPGKLNGAAHLRALVRFEDRPKPWTPTVTLGPPALGRRAAEWLHFMRAVDGIKSVYHVNERWWEVMPRQRDVLAVIDGDTGEIQHVLPVRARTWFGAADVDAQRAEQVRSTTAPGKRGA